jgi:hypothetical protein
VHVIPNLSDRGEDYVKIIDSKIPELGKTKTMFVFVDSMSKRITTFLECLFEIFGNECNYIGGGAGTLSFEPFSCLITNQGLIQDSAVLALLNAESSIGIRHGWRTIGGPYKITDSDGNMLITLNWKPAFKVYREVIKIHSGKNISATNFLEIAQVYPLGIKKMPTEKIVREPLEIEKDGILICNGEVPKDSFIDILHGNTASLIEAAKNAAVLSNEEFPINTKKKLSIFFDGISRLQFLQENFQKEIDAVYNDKIPLIGALSIGEIANSGKDYLEFYNKTSVVGILDAQ